jgi:Uma2 family endonuclease
MEEARMEALRYEEEPLEPDVSHLVTEDDAPVDSWISEKQMRLFPNILHASWKPGRPFVAAADVGLFGSVDEPAVVPDIMVSLDVTLPEDCRPKGRRSYFTWVFGKAPDLVIEVVSNREGSEVEKAQRYARLGVRYYVIFDPERWLGDRVLRGYVLHGLSYVELLDLSWLEELGLGLVTWQGRCEDMEGLWLRPCGRDKALLPLPTEVAEAAQSRAEAAQAQVEEERARAEQERARAERLLARLRELGVEE